MFGFEIFRKLTFTGLGLNYHSYSYMNFKVNNIKTLLFRAYKLCSNWLDFHKEAEFLLSYFKKNGYPERLVFNVLNKFLVNTFRHKPIVHTAEKLIMYVKFPFLNNVCSQFMKNEIGAMLKFKYPYIDFKFFTKKILIG